MGVNVCKGVDVVVEEVHTPPCDTPQTTHNSGPGSTQRNSGYGATMTDSPFMTYQEAADYLRVSRDTISR